MPEKPVKMDRSGWCSDEDRTYHHYCKFTYEGLRSFLRCPCDCHEGTVVDDREVGNGAESRPRLAPKTLTKVPVTKRGRIVPKTLALKTR